MPYPRSKPPAGGVKSAFPGFIEPALATSIDKVPSGERWVHEIKFDGYRVHVSGRVNDWVKKTCAQRETLAIAGFALDGKKWDGIISAGARAKS
jgi:ATP-dependent DNA ligase